jgi:hypothetical protein
VVVSEEPLAKQPAKPEPWVTTVDAAAGPGAMSYFQLPSNFKLDSKHVYVVEVYETADRLGPLSKHISLHMAPKDLDIVKGVNVTVSVSTTIESTVVVSNQGAGAALYVTLTTQAQGRFQENCFLLQAGEEKDVYFVAAAQANAGGQQQQLQQQLELLETTTRVEHLGMYI